MMTSKIIWWFLVFLYAQARFILNNHLKINSGYFLTSSKISDSNNTFKPEVPLKFNLKLTSQKSYEIILNSKSLPIVPSISELLVYKQHENVKWNFTNVNFVQGFVGSYPNSSRVVGQISGVYFYGVVRILNAEFRLESLKNYPIIYNKNKDAGKNAIVIMDEEGKVYTEKTFRGSGSDRYKSFIGKGKSCPLFVLLDNSFLRITHGNDIDSAIAHATMTLDTTDSIFRSTDFDGDGDVDNVGFEIRYMAVIESEMSPMNVLLPFSSTPVESVLYLQRLSQYPILSEVCLGVAFTAQTFKGSVIGLSFTAELFDPYNFKLPIGGICDRTIIRRALISLNSLVVSSRHESGDKIPQFVMELSLAHELGHSFGSDHDNSSPECSGYIMSPNAPKEYTVRNYHFSPCSRRSIVRTLLGKGYCMEDYEQPYCGNGRVEEGESCDCGTEKDCLAFDQCCVPRGRADSCRVNTNKGYVCHPSQSICCSESCTYNDLSLYGLNCSRFLESCPCKDEAKVCTCGVGGECVKDSCHSVECTRLNLTECECPTGCRTCCRYNKRCSSSYEITNLLIEKRNNLLPELIKRQNQIQRFNPKLMQSNKLCIRNDCLFFREDKFREYCLLFGEVGRCSNTNNCIISKSRIYPKVSQRIRSVDKRSSSGNSNLGGLTALIYIWISICTSFGYSS